MSINKIDIISIPVSDQGESKQFYEKIVGFKVIRDNPFPPNGRWIELAPADAETSITLVTWFDNMPPGSIQGAVLDTSDITTTHEELESRGLKISPIEDAPWGKYATFSDPDGNGWVLQEVAPDA